MRERYPDIHQNKNWSRSQNSRLCLMLSVYQTKKKKKLGLEVKLKIPSLFGLQTRRLRITAKFSKRMRGRERDANTNDPPTYVESVNNFNGLLYFCFEMIAKKRNRCDASTCISDGSEHIRIQACIYVHKSYVEQSW